jgi:adenylate cyclase
MAAGRWLEETPPRVIALGLGALVAAAVIGLRALGAVEALEFGAYDHLVSFSGKERHRSRVVLVLVREADITQHGYPLPDGVLARATEALVALGPRAIGLDLFRPVPVPPGSEAFEEIVLRHRNVVLVDRVGDDGPLVPAPAWAPPSQIGFGDFVRDGDGKLRRALLMMEAPGASALSLSLRLATRYLARDPSVDQPVFQWKGSTLTLNGQRFKRFRSEDGAYVREDDRGYQVLLDYRGAFQRLERYSFADVLEGRLPREAVEDRVVLVGTVADSLTDDHMTPEATASGVEIHGVIVDHLLGRALSGEAGLRVLPPLAEAGLIFALGLLAALLVPVLNSALLVLAEAVLGLSIAAGLSYGAFAYGWWLPAVPAAVVWFAALGATASIASFAERAKRRRFADLMDRVVTPEVAHEIWERREEFLDAGRPKGARRVATALFCDIQGFSSTAEQMDPEALMEWANPIFSGLAAAIAHHGGLVDDYAGDGIKADFGIFGDDAAKGEQSQAVQAVEAALEMERVIERFNREAEESGRKKVRIRVGINTGRAMIGFLGNPDRLKFTTLGDSVNTAARLEGWDKEGFSKEGEQGGPCIRILVSGATRALLGARFELQDLGDAELKGKRENVRVYRVWGPAKPAQAAAAAAP